MNKLDGDAMAMRLGLRSTDRSLGYFNSAVDMFAPAVPLNDKAKIVRKSTNTILAKPDEGSIVIGSHTKRRSLNRRISKPKVEETNRDHGMKHVPVQVTEAFKAFRKQLQTDVELPPLLPKQKMATKSSMCLSENQMNDLKKYSQEESKKEDSKTPRENYTEAISSFDAHERKNMHINRPTTPNSRFIAECKKLNILPEPIVAKAVQATDGKLNLASFGCGDRMITALSTSLALMKNISNINLKDNRLTDDSIVVLLKNVPVRRIRRLTLSDNKIRKVGAKAVANFLQHDELNLTELSLENNQLTEDDVIGIIQAMSLGNGIRVMNLNRCNVGHRAAAAIAQLLTQNTILEELYVSWNKIRGPGAICIGKALELSNNLHTLDLSWNSLGGCGNGGISSISNSLRRNTALTHLDISHNRLQFDHCKVLAEALLQNHTLNGIHVGGNQMEVDTYGFIFPNCEANDPVNNHIFTRIRSSDELKGSDDGKNQNWDKRANCWICEHWNKFRYAFDSTTVDKDCEIFLFTEFDYWKPILVELSGDGKEFEIFRMTPPGASQYYFGNATGTFIHPGRPSQTFRRRLVGGIMNTPPKDAPSVVNVASVDALKNKKDILQPRQFKQEEMSYEDWFKQSVFASYRVDDEKLLGDAFAFDWKHSRIAKMAKDADERLRVKATLFQAYVLLKNAFKQYSCNSGDPFTMGSNAFSDFIHDCNIVDEVTCQRTEVEMSFITSNMSGPKCKENQKRSLLRFQFIEVIASLGIAKFYSSKKAANPSEAIQKLLDEHIIPNATWHDSQAYRNGPTGRLYTVDVDLVLKENLLYLEDLFNTFAGSQKLSILGAEKKMTLGELQSLVEQAGLIDNVLTAREVKIAILYSNQTEVNELKDADACRTLVFVEFLETIARISDMKDLSPFFNKIIQDVHQTPELKSLVTSFQIFNSEPTDWLPETGNLALKIRVVLHILYSTIIKHRSIISPKFSTQLNLLHSMYRTTM